MRTLRHLLVGSYRRRRGIDHGDTGQTLLLAVIVIAILAASGAAIVTAVVDQLPLTTNAVNQRAAYAAIESGIQAYRAQLNAAGPDVADNASDDTVIDQWNLASTTAKPVEEYYVNPNPAFTKGGFTGSPWADDEILATITGRAGTSTATSQSTQTISAIKNVVYESAVIAFKQYATYLSNAYYSTYEVLDPNYPDPVGTTGLADPDVSVSTTVNGVTTTDSSVPEQSVDFTYQYKNSSGTLVTVGPTDLRTALCGYDDYQENTFLDGQGDLGYTDNVKNNLVTGHTTFTSTYPYYGAYFGIPSSTGAWGSPSSDLTFTVNALDGGTETIKFTSTSTLPCSSQYAFIHGEVFSGPVYSSDELAICDTTENEGPDFQGEPVSLLSGTPTTFYFDYDWPGSYKATSGPLSGDYVPYGYTDDFASSSCASSNKAYWTPSLSGSLEEGANEVLPTFDQSLEDDTDGVATNPQTGKPLYGCLFTGPTMVELVDGTSGEYMDVWSPLSKKTDMSGGTACGSGQFSPSHAWVTDIAMPTDGVLYDQNVPESSTDPNYWSANALNAITSASTSCATGSQTCVDPPDGETTASSTCFINPEYPSSTADTSPCTEGDLYVGGELNGQLTMGADQNVFITRDLSYSCAQSSGVPATTLGSACQSESTPDLLGLYANKDILFSHPVSSSGTNDSTCSDWSGTSPTDTVADVEPNCDVTSTNGAVVDAVLIALNGSFGIQNYNDGAALGDMNVNGADIAEYRGPFGVFDSNGYLDGYDKTFNYDTRLSYLAPPYAISPTNANWYPWGWVDCGGLNLSKSTSPTCSAS